MSRPMTTLAEALSLNLPLTEPQIAEFLQISTRGVRRLLKAGMPSWKVNGQRRFDVASVRTWLSSTLPKLETQSAGLHTREQRLHS